MCLKCLAFTLLPLIFFHYRPNNSYVDIVKVMGRGLLLEDETCENYDYPCFWGVCVCVRVCTCLWSVRWEACHMYVSSLACQPMGTHRLKTQ